MIVHAAENGGEWVKIVDESAKMAEPWLYWIRLVVFFEQKI